MVKTQLQDAYRYIKAGQHATALKLLAPICKNDPTNATAWWLAAHAFDDDDHIRYALQQVLTIDPNFPGAAEKFARLQSATLFQATLPVQKQTVTTPSKKSSTSGFGWILGFTLILIVVAISVAVVFVLQRDNSATQTPTQVIADVQNISQVSSTPINAPILSPTTSIRIIPTLPPQNTATPIPPSFTPTIPPPTRTPRPTSTPIPTFVAPATTDPGLFGETYWEGAGDGTNMETYVSSRGRYLRFYRFPVLVYVVNGNTQERRNAVNGALKEISQVVQIRVTEDELEADIVLEFVSFDALQERCEAEIYLVVGCGTIDYFGGGTVEPIIKGSALVNAEESYSMQATILHELLHAMGIFAHSPNPNDVMYFEENGVTQMSQRDINTLHRLYEGSPSYAYNE